MLDYSGSDTINLGQQGVMSGSIYSTAHNRERSGRFQEIEVGGFTASS